MIVKSKDAVWLGLFDALRLFPFSLAVGVCSGYGILGGFVAAAVCVVCGALFGCAFLPSWWTLLPVYALAFRFGSGAASAAVLIGGVFAFFLSLLPQDTRKRLFTPSVLAGFWLSAALATTALQTTNYFGIGAVGGTVPQIMADYVSLGFHPNWRGVLYGTIVMVVLITYPRKFKQFSKKLSAAFVALAVTLPLHWLLVPHAAGSPVDEIGAFSLGSFLDGAWLAGEIPTSAIPMILCAGLSLALLMTWELPEKPIQGLSVASMGCGALGGVPVCTDGTPRTVLSAVVCAVGTAALYLVPGLSRMPVHALAVVLIVTGWQKVPWGAIAHAFKGGVRSIASFVCAVLLTVLLGVHYAVPLLAAVSVLLPEKDNRKGCS